VSSSDSLKPSILFGARAHVDSHPVVFADDGSAAAGQACTPVLEWPDLLQAVQLPDIFESFVNELPGARKVWVDLAPVFA
jgi:hypothetical protein